MSKRKSENPDVRAMAKRALEWMETDDGRKSSEEADRQVTKTAELLEKGYDIDPAKLYDPFTV